MRLSRSVIAVLLASLSVLLPLHAYAEAPMAKTQTPGYYRMMLGRFEVTALRDGSTQLNAGLLKNVSNDEIKKLLARQFIDDPQKIPTSVNAYLINTGAKLVLVDAGGGAMCGPTMGQLLENLKASGYRPEQVDAVLVTHLHPDHCAGLLDAAGKPMFANATVYVSKPESEYWLSVADPAKAPAQYRQHMAMAVKLVRTVSAPYVAADRWKTFTAAELPITGVRAVAIPGHTPGHTAYEFASEGHTLLIIGDMIHCGAIQFPRPDAAVDFDSTPKQAVETRLLLFRRLAAAKTLVADMHLAFPGLGHLRTDSENSYTWVPVEYSPTSK